MDISRANINKSKLFSSGQSGSIDKALASQEIKRVQQINQSIRQNEAITPQNYNLGAVSQLVNSKYLFELRKDIKRILKGRKLSEFLEHEFTEEEFDELPTSLKNLLVFKRKVGSTEIVQFMESSDKSHEITFRDFAFNRIKFRALFEALGELLDVEMLAGDSTYIPLNNDFKVKRKVSDIFNTLSDKIKESLGLKPNLKKFIDESRERPKQN